MKIPKEYKVIIFKAFLKGLITKDELRFLCEKGVSIPPIAWIDGSEEEIKERDILERALEIKFFRIGWA